MAGMPDPKPRRWFRYSLRTLFIVMTVVCLVSGFWLNKAFRQRDAVRRFNQLNSHRSLPLGISLTAVGYRHAGKDEYVNPRISPWLYPLSLVLGEEAFGEVTGVQLAFTDATDDDLRYLADLPTVERIWLTQTKVTDRGMRRLLACPNLKILGLNHTAITDHGIAQIVASQELKYLSLDGTKISDASLGHLAKLTKLEYLSLRDTAITKAGYRQLQAALPECGIHTDFSAVHP